MSTSVADDSQQYHLQELSENISRMESALRCQLDECRAVRQSRVEMEEEGIEMCQTLNEYTCRISQCALLQTMDHTIRDQYTVRLRDSMSLEQILAECITPERVPFTLLVNKTKRFGFRAEFLISRHLEEQHGLELEFCKQSVQMEGRSFVHIDGVLQPDDTVVVVLSPTSHSREVLSGLHNQARRYRDRLHDPWRSQLHEIDIVPLRDLQGENRQDCP